MLKLARITLSFAVFFSCFHANLPRAQLQAQTTPQSPKQPTAQPKPTPAPDKNEIGNLIDVEAIKAANAVEDYSGEERGLNAGVMIRSGLQLLELDASGFSLGAFVCLLAKVDFTRSNDLAKSLKYDAPRAVATLAVASAALEKQPRKN